MMSCSFEIDHYLNRPGCLKSHSTRASAISGEPSAHARRLMFLFPNALQVPHHSTINTAHSNLSSLSVNKSVSRSLKQKKNIMPSQVSLFKTTSSFALQYPSHPLGLNNMLSPKASAFILSLVLQKPDVSY